MQNTRIPAVRGERATVIGSNTLIHPSHFSPDAFIDTSQPGLMTAFGPQVIEFILPDTVTSALALQSARRDAVYRAYQSFIEIYSPENQTERLDHPVNQQFVQGLLQARDPYKYMVGLGFAPLIHVFGESLREAPILTGTEIPAWLVNEIRTDMHVIPDRIQTLSLQRVEATLIVPHVFVGEMPTFGRQTIARQKTVEKLALATRKAISQTERGVLFVAKQSAGALQAVGDLSVSVATHLAQRVIRVAESTVEGIDAMSFWTPPDPVHLSTRFNLPQELSAHLEYYLFRGFNEATAIGSQLMTLSPETFHSIEPRFIEGIMNTVDIKTAEIVKAIEQARGNLTKAAPGVLTALETYFLDDIMLRTPSVILQQNRLLHATADPLIINS